MATVDEWSTRRHETNSTQKNENIPKDTTPTPNSSSHASSMEGIGSPKALFINGSYHPDYFRLFTSQEAQSKREREQERMQQFHREAERQSTRRNRRKKRKQKKRLQTRRWARKVREKMVEAREQKRSPSSPHPTMRKQDRTVETKTPKDQTAFTFARQDQRTQ